MFIHICNSPQLNCNLSSGKNLMYDLDDEKKPFLNRKKVLKKVKKQVLNFYLVIKPHRILIIQFFLAVLAMSTIAYLLLPYVGWNFVFLRNYCFWPLSGEYTWCSENICKPHPLGRGCYHDSQLLAEVISVFREIQPNQQ